MKEVLVSVVIPFYRGIEWLMEAVESVLSQAYRNIEIIVINDGSPENISEFLKKYKTKIRYIRQENKGAATARNKGIELSKGEYIAFLDADDIWNPHKLENQISCMIKNDAHWSHSSYVTFIEEKNNKIVNVSRYQGNIFPLCIISNPIATPSVIVKTSVFRKDINLRFDENIQFGEDTILWMKLSMKYEILAIDEILVKVRIRGTNSALMSYSQIKARSDIWYTIKDQKLFNYKKELRILPRYAFEYCIYSNKILTCLQRKIPQNLIEFISKSMYLIPWIAFKIEKNSLI